MLTLLHSRIKACFCVACLWSIVQCLSGLLRLISFNEFAIFMLKRIRNKHPHILFLIAFSSLVKQWGWSLFFPPPSLTAFEHCLSCMTFWAPVCNVNDSEFTQAVSIKNSYPMCRMSYKTKWLCSWMFLWTRQTRTNIPVTTLNSLHIFVHLSWVMWSTNCF